MTDQPDYFERTYPADLPSILGTAHFSGAEKAALTRSLRADAKEAGHSLGPTEVVGRSGLLGGAGKVTVRAPIVGPYMIGQPEGEEPGGE